MRRQSSRNYAPFWLCAISHLLINLSESQFPILKKNGNKNSIFPPYRITLEFKGWIYVKYTLKDCVAWASLVAQWLRICLPMQGTWVWALVWEDPTCRRAAKPVRHNYWACTSGACAPQQQRPAHLDEEWPPLAATGESPHTETKTQHSQK